MPNSKSKSPATLPTRVEGDLDEERSLSLNPPTRRIDQDAENYDGGDEDDYHKKLTKKMMKMSSSSRGRGGEPKQYYIEEEGEETMVPIRDPPSKKPAPQSARKKHHSGKKSVKSDGSTSYLDISDDESCPGAHQIGNLAGVPERMSESVSHTTTLEQPQLQSAVNAYLVTNVNINEDEEEGAKAKPVYDAEEWKERPWYKHPCAILTIFVLILGVAIALGVTLSREPTVNLVPTAAPTISFAPTAMALVTLSVQLDDRAIETGWSLSCEQMGEVQNVPQGSYAFLPVGDGGLIPNFRIEVVVDLIWGDSCFFTITDSMGDGLVGGFYEIYFGDDVGRQDMLLSRASFSSASTTTLFQVMEPEQTNGGTQPSAPSDSNLAQPTMAPSKAGVQYVCTVCPDGTPVPDPEFLIQERGRTCGQLEYQAGFVSNEGVCQELFHAYAQDCGCDNYCSALCPDGSRVDEASLDKLVSVSPIGRPKTCADEEMAVMQQNTPVADCNRANFIGETVCDCPPSGKYCTICQNEALPGDPTRHIIPGIACDDISGIAYTILESNPLFPFLCPGCLAIGAYCACPEPEENPRVFCRMCGGTKLLPVPDKIVFSPLLNITTTCFHVEFFANLGIAPDGTTDPRAVESCSVIQEQHGDECCEIEE